MKRGVPAAAAAQRPAARQCTLDGFLGDGSRSMKPSVEPLERSTDGSAYTVCPGCGERIALAYAKVHIDAECLRSPPGRAGINSWEHPQDDPLGGASQTRKDDELDDVSFLAACEAACVQAETSSGTQSNTSVSTLPTKKTATDDIEDLAGRPSTPLERWRQRGLFVTDLSAQAWCETQVEANLAGDKPPIETDAMRAGTAIHNAKEAELHIHVPIATASREDAAAVRLLNTLLLLHELRQRGITRELPLFGFVPSDDVLCWQSAQPGSCLAAGSTPAALGLPEHIMIWGIADEIRRETPQKAAERQNSPRSESGVIDLTATDLADCYVLRELKTRRQHSMPSDAQARGTALQLCIYKQLWDQLCAPGAAGRFPAVHFWAIQRVDPLKPFSPTFAAELCSSLEPLGIGATTLSELLRHTFTQFANFPVLHAEMRVTYVLQQPRQAIEARQVCSSHASSAVAAEKGQRQTARQRQSERAGAPEEVIVGTEMVLFDSEWLDRCVKYALGFWLGVREPSAVSWDERFKCRYCPYSDTCARQPRSPQAQHGQQRERPAHTSKPDSKHCAGDEFEDMDELFASLPDELLR